MTRPEDYDQLSPAMRSHLAACGVGRGEYEHAMEQLRQGLEKKLTGDEIREIFEFLCVDAKCPACGVELCSSDDPLPGRLEVTCACGAVLQLSWGPHGELDIDYATPRAAAPARSCGGRLGHVFAGDAQPGDPCACGETVRGHGVRSLIDAPRRGPR